MIRKEYLRAKIRPPEVRHTLVPIKNIADIIDGVPLDQAVFLVAPYGYGKTLAVVSWLRERGLDAAWLTFGAEDNDENIFLADISAAVMRICGFEGNTDDILADPVFAADRLAFLWDAVLRAEESAAHRILVMDNSRFMNVDPAALASFKEIVSGLLGRWRVVVISRSEPPPLFNDLMLERKIYLITIRELAFTPEETEQFFVLNGCPVSQREVAEISEQTEGWPAAMNVILTLSRGGPAVYSDVARGYITEFFETEIWRELDGGIKDFLLKTSVLETLTPALCCAVTDLDATLPILRRLYINGIFISRPGQNEEYRYHRVFQDYLRAKLDGSDIDARALYKKAGRSLFEKNEFQEAFIYFFKAGDMYGLGRTLRALSLTDMAMDKYAAFTARITQLDADSLKEYPLIVARMALTGLVLGDVGGMQRLHGIFRGSIKPGALPLTPEEYAECAWEAGWLDFLDPGKAVAIDPAFIKWLANTERDPRLNEMHNNRRIAFAGPSVLRGPRELCPVAGALDVILQKREREGGAYQGTGPGNLLLAEIATAEIAYEKEDFAAAGQIARRAMEEAEARKYTDLYMACAALLIRLARAKGPGGTDAVTERLEKTIAENGHAALMPAFYALQLKNMLKDGYTGQTEEFRAANRDYADKQYFHLTYSHLVSARALLSERDLYGASMLLSRLERLCREYKRGMDLIEINILKSAAEHMAGNADSARASLAEAIEGARGYGFIRIFSDDADMLWPVLEHFTDAGDDYLRKIIISCKKALSLSGMSSARKDGAYAGLTKTELKILKVLPTDLSYDEIAYDNGITLSTVKSHIHSIYSKLNAANRAGAVTAARNLRLID